jgi:hypothetical protein
MEAPMSRILLLCLITACTPWPHGVATNDLKPSNDPAVEMIIADLQRRLPSTLAGDTISRSRLTILKDTSEVIKNVVYTWGVYIPPRTADVIMVSVVASVANQHETLRTTADWGRIAALGSWAPATELDVIAGCEELIRMISPFRTPRWPARVYRDSASTPWSSLTRPEKVASLVQAPSASNDGNDWIANVWVLEYGRVGQHRCQFTDNSTTHTVIQAERNIGFPGVGGGM